MAQTLGASIPRYIRPSRVSEVVARALGNYPCVLLVDEKWAREYIPTQAAFDRCGLLLAEDAAEQNRASDAARLSDEP